VTAPRRTRLDPDARRAQLVELGVRALSRASLYDVNLDEIAAAAGISRSLLFHYFGSKRRFQLAVVQAAAAGLLQGTDPDPALPADRQLRASIEDSVDQVPTAVESKLE
jgi:AcrR family transcriptional regulator